MARRRLPMFPLGTVLFPHAVIPLHVFEPRYRALMRHCLDADRRFGVVLIERGSEVGGGDQRADVGTQGVISRAGELPDGRWVLEVVGEVPVVIEEWLPDDPYPVALVSDHPGDGPSAEESSEAETELEALCLQAIPAHQTHTGGARRARRGTGPSTRAAARRWGQHRGGVVAALCGRASEHL